MTALNWPENIYPVQQTFFIRSETARSISELTGQTQAFGRDSARWVATLDFRLTQDKAAIFEALLADLRGPVGTLLVPDFRRKKNAPDHAKHGRLRRRNRPNLL